MRSVDEKMFPEVGAGGYHRQSGRVAFFTRIASILPENAHVLDFGAGRGIMTRLESPGVRVHTDLTKRVQRYAAFDVDPVVLSNEDTDDRHHADIGAPLPFPDNSFDVVFSWMVFEHIADPAFYAKELHRIVKPGGWICAVTPNKWGLVGLVSRLVPDRFHVGVVERMTKGREAEDVFPTCYRLNTRADIRRYFGPALFTDCSFFFRSGPAYHGGKLPIAYLWQFVNWLLPPAMDLQFHIFLQKKA